MKDVTGRLDEAQSKNTDPQKKWNRDKKGCARFPMNNAAVNRAIFKFTAN